MMYSTTANEGISATSLWISQPEQQFPVIYLNLHNEIALIFLLGLVVLFQDWISSGRSGLN